MRAVLVILAGFLIGTVFGLFGFRLGGDVASAAIGAGAFVPAWLQ